MRRNKQEKSKIKRAREKKVNFRKYDIPIAY